MLGPRRSVQYEVGGKLSFGPVFATVALYEIERPGEGPITAADGTRRFGYVGEQRHRGIEFVASGELVAGLRLIGGAAYTDAEIRRERADPLPVRGVPEYTANANVEWDLPFAPGLTLTGRVVHTGEQPANLDGSRQLDDWTVLDLGARYVFVAAERPVTLRLTVDNVTDEAYWASAFDVFNDSLLQGAPRQVNASVSVDF